MAVSGLRHLFCLGYMSVMSVSYKTYDVFHFFNCIVFYMNEDIKSTILQPTGRFLFRSIDDKPL